MQASRWRLLLNTQPINQCTCRMGQPYDPPHPGIHRTETHKRQPPLAGVLEDRSELGVLEVSARRETPNPLEIELTPRLAYPGDLHATEQPPRGLFRWRSDPERLSSPRRWPLCSAATIAPPPKPLSRSRLPINHGPSRRRCGSFEPTFRRHRSRTRKRFSLRGGSRFRLFSSWLRQQTNAALLV